MSSSTSSKPSSVENAGSPTVAQARSASDSNTSKPAPEEQDSSVNAQEEKDSETKQQPEDTATAKEPEHAATAKGSKEAKKTPEPVDATESETTLKARDEDDVTQKTESEADKPGHESNIEAAPSEEEVAGDDQDEQEETLDLSALFASSEPDFGSPTDTFELARGAKVETGSLARRSQSTEARQPQGQKEGLGVEDDEQGSELPIDPGTMASGDGWAQPGEPESQNATREESSSSVAGADQTHAPGDPLADAVQSALRSVYGDEQGYQDDDAYHHSAPGGENPVLQWARADASNRRSNAAVEAEDASFDEKSQGDSPHDMAIDEETTEAVLSYLYEHVAEPEAASPEAGRLEPGEYGAFDRQAQHDGRARGEWSDRQAAPPTNEYRASGSLGAAEDNPAAGSTGDTGSASQQSYETQSVGASVPAIHAAHTSDGTNEPFDFDNSEASGKLLGAAGLGLIGGIAAAGVAAVFVFNSFVTKHDTSSVRASPEATSATTLSEDASQTESAAISSSEKDDSRLSSSPAATPSSQLRTGDDAQTSRPTTPTADRGEETPSSARTAALTASEDPASVKSQADITKTTPRLDIKASDVSGPADQQIPLALSTPEREGDSFVRIEGLPPGAKLSAGVDTGNGSWLLSAGRADDLSLKAPESLTGEFTLKAQMLGADARTPLSDEKEFAVSISQPDTATSETRTAAVDPETPPAVVDQPPSALDRAKSLLRAGDVLAARDVLRAQVRDGNAKAALAMGRSYDPRSFSDLTSANASPDATKAFRWYQRAAELGEAEGKTQMSKLKNWLLR